MRTARSLDLAAGASTLSERLRVVDALRGAADALRAGGAEPPDATDPLTAWRIRRLSTRLADKFQQEARHLASEPRHTAEELAEALTAFHRFERDLAAEADKPDERAGNGGTGHLDRPDERTGPHPATGEHAAPDPRALLEDLHAEWLPTYRDALRNWDSRHESPAGAGISAGTEVPGEAARGTALSGGEAAPRNTAPAGRNPTWREPDVYYGRLATACEPFLLELARRLEEVRAGLTARIDDGVLDDLQRHLHDRLTLALAWAVEADANVHCAQHGLDREQAGQQEYLVYLDETFADAAAYHRFFRSFPVLGRWLAQLTAQLSDYGAELLRHWDEDAELVGAEFFGSRIAAFRAVRLGDSDYHAGGRSVALVTAELDDGRQERFYCKPRCLRSELGLQRVLSRLCAEEVVAFAARPVLALDGRGYEALIPDGRNHVDTTGAAAHVYRELGGQMALFHVLGGGDLHFENILVCDGHAFICDGETVFGVQPRGRGRATGTLLDSVLSTGLLEWPRSGESGMKISGYTGGESYELPIEVAQLSEQRLSFAAAVHHRTGLHVEVSGANRVFLHGELVHPQEHVESIVDGFERVHRWFEQDPEHAIAVISEAFEGTSARFINRGTQIYSQLLLAAQHPRCLADPLEVDLLLNTMRTFPRNWDHDSELAERELASMWRLDVPLFTAELRSERLVHDRCETLPPTLDSAPLDRAAERIRRVSPENREQQTRYITASLSLDEISSPAFVATTLDYAERIGRRLCGMLRPPDAPSPWTAFRLDGDEFEAADVEGDLFHGSAGIALFLAYLDELVPRAEYRRAARRALDHALAERPERLGAFVGLGGQLYLLAHLHALWGEPELAERAERLCDDLPQRIAADIHYDVLHGAAGLIPVLLGWEPVLGERAVDLARQCARHVLDSATDRGAALSWPSFTPGDVLDDLTGFSHGTAGIGWALVLLGARTGEAEFIEAGRRAFAYEGQHFDPDEQDWYDLRRSTGPISRGDKHFANAWCNGAAGIGLSRIACWAELGETDEDLLHEAYLALSATMRNFSRLQNHTLCHGTAGNSELLLRFARLRDEPAFQLEANVQVRQLWRALDDAAQGISDNSSEFFPGLLLGISGFGMHFLRIARPERVPSPLLLDPPARY